MQIAGWGNHPYIDARITAPRTLDAVNRELENVNVKSLDAENDHAQTMIVRGLGRSYGDSSLAAEVIASRQFNGFQDFDPQTGELQCLSGTSLAEILDIFVPRGWFLPVTPGTKFVTVGGAVASDIHGKNHHVEGCFSDHVTEITLLTPGEGIVTCSKEIKADLFRATCGGMGLTGMIISVAFKLKKITSAMVNTLTLKAKNLEKVLELFEAHASYTYSVAWIDCLSTGDKLGRSLLMLGEHASAGRLKTAKQGKLAVPFNMPSFVLNQFSIQLFNTLYYHKVMKEKVESIQHYDGFFYPLDGIHDWNRMYGKNGFVQYQFVIPKAVGHEGLKNVLSYIAKSKRGSFLAVLKVFGAGNENLLSFPFEGYTLALDFKVGRGLKDFLKGLDEIVMALGGRLYLTKDACMSEAFFKQSYPKWQQFQEIRKAYGADSVYNSLQSKRLGL